MKILWLAIALGVVSVAGCRRSAPAVAPAKPPEVMVAAPITREITEYQDFAGRTDAMTSVEIRSRVTGYLEKANFVEGSEVKKGDVLFEIDDRQYRAEVERTKADLDRMEVRVKRLAHETERGKSLLATRAISSEDFEKIAGEHGEANAAVGVARANKQLAELNLKFTQLIAPVSGLIGRHQIDPGNLVKSDDTILTSIVSLDPIHAYFNVDERTLLRLRRLNHEGKAKSADTSHLKVRLSLADEKDFPHLGEIDFLDNKVDPGTGTLRVRAIFQNSNRLLSPGLFVRIRIPIGNSHPAVLIPEVALGADQSQKFVYVVNEQNKIVYRKIRVGTLVGAWREITEGIAMGERVVTSGVQRVRPGIEVNASEDSALSAALPTQVPSSE